MKPMGKVTENPSAATATVTALAPQSAPHPSWVEVSTSALRHNFRLVHSFVSPQAAVCAVVKSDAYGHGAPACALALQEEGAKWLAVNTVEEAMALREAGIRGRVLLLAGPWRGDEETIINQELSPAIWEPAHVALLEDAAKKLRTPNHVAAHLKINTGMNRLGADLKDLPAMFEALRAASHVRLEGAFSHFAAAEVVDLAHGDEQVALFEQAVTQAENAGFKPLLRHMANSAAIVVRPKARFDMVRPGLALYGYFLPLRPANSGQPDASLELPVKPVLSWKTRVLQVRDVAGGQPIGYSGNYVTSGQARIAVLPVGYGDGLNRLLSSRGRVIVRNRYVPIVGNISMNLTTVDVTGISGVRVGDEVILIGESGPCKITGWEHAGLASTIPYEILCGISGRLRRKYVE